MLFLLARNASERRRSERGARESSTLTAAVPRRLLSSGKTEKPFSPGLESPSETAKRRVGWAHLSTLDHVEMVHAQIGSIRRLSDRQARILAGHSEPMSDGFCLGGSLGLLIALAHGR